MFDITGMFSDEDMVRHLQVCLLMEIWSDITGMLRLLMKMWFDVTGMLVDERMVQH